MTSSTTTGAMASGADADVAEMISAANAVDPSVPTEQQIDRLRGAADALAALAAPAPVVPEEVRRLQSQRDMTLETLRTLGVRLGVLDPCVACDGPQLLAAMDAYSDHLAATPSKPVGDGPEASAPPAGGGAVDVEGDWAGILAYSILCRKGYAYDHLVDAVAIELRRIEAVGYTKGYEACHASRKTSLAAAPAAPEPAAGGEAAPLSLGRIKDAISYFAHCCQDGSVSIPRHRLLEWREGIRAILSAPSGVETAGGDGWSFDMEAAPKDKPILAWVDHEADPSPLEGARLTLYASHAEGMGHAPTGFAVVEWGGGFDDRTYEYPNEGHLPDWWFVAGSDFEVAANPVAWKLIEPPKPTPTNAGAEGGQA